MTFFFFSDGAPVKSHAEANQKHRSLDYQSKHQGTSKPTWLLALEVVTGVMVGSLFLVALLTAFHRCNSKSSLIIPWKKSASEKDHVTVYVGQFIYHTSSSVDWKYLKVLFCFLVNMLINLLRFLYRF